MSGEAPREIREIIAGRPGAANRFLKRFSKPILDYATALIPDRSEPFERLVEDILVDAIAQSRAAARFKEDEQVFEFVMEVALHTVRARYKHVLDGEARPTKATTSYNFKEVMERTKMSEAELTAGISEGKIRAVRDNDQMKIKGDSIPGLGERKAYHAYHVSAAERELLCLHYRLHFSPETIARWSGSTPAQVEAVIGKAANQLTSAIAKRRGARGPEVKDTEMRRYIDGRMEGDETAKFERSVLKDKIAQQRLDELRSQSDSIRELFDSGPCELSSIAVNVRARNPHHALAMPPVAALWLQVVGLAALMLMFHSVGAYIAPPDVHATAVIGDATLPPTVTREGEQPNTLANSESVNLAVGDWLETPESSQALLVLDKSNRVLLAPGSKAHLLEPRPDARQVLLLEKGEVWGRFTSSGHAFAMQFGTPEAPEGEIASDVGAEFDLVLAPGADLIPDNLNGQLVRALQNVVEPKEDGGLEVLRALNAYAGFRFGNGEEGLVSGDIIEKIQGVALVKPEDFGVIAGGMAVDDSLPMSVRRGDERLAFTITRTGKQPWAVVRVFHGAVIAGAPGGDRPLVNAGQWALFYTDEPPLIGLRGMEDFRVLRIDSNERFKERLHWLNVEHFPLRAEYNVLQVERALRELAESLELMRADKIQRNGEREIVEFENIMRAVIADAKARIERGEAREKEAGSESLSDKALVAAEDEIIAIILNWKRRSTSGIYPTLGSASKTLSSAISRDETELEDRGSELTESLLRQEQIDDLDGSIGLQDGAINDLKASEFYDEGGEKRADLDSQIAAQEQAVKDGASAKGRKDLILVKLNDLDAKIDTQRRKLADLKQAVADAQAALDETKGLILANIYTPEKLQAALAAVTAAERSLETAKANVAAAKEDVADKEALLVQAEAALTKATTALTTRRDAVDAASDALTDAIATRATAQAEVDDAQDTVNRIQDELDALAEGDPARQQIQVELDAAKQALADKQQLLDQAVTAAETANTALKSAEEAVTDAESTASKKAKDVDTAKDAVKTAEDARDDAQASQQPAEQALGDASESVKALEDAKTARALLETRQTEQTETLGKAEGDLDGVNTKIADLDKQAEPEREKLAAEQALIDNGEEAADKIKELRTERGRYQAISDEIELRNQDRAELVAQRDALSNSDLVKNFERLQEEYTALSARIDAFKFVRARGLLEDSSFAYAQDAAQHAFKEAAENAELQAVEVLREYCPAYGHEEYDKTLDDKLFTAILSSMWKLYYDAGLHGSDEDGEICYYVAVQSGADSKTLEALDNRWQAYLTKTFGSQGFESISKLEAAHLKRK